MKTRRTSIEIIAEMLRLGEAEVGKTRMMYAVNMSHSQLERYIDFLLNGDFLEAVRNGSSVRYRMTRKGRHLLDNIDRMADVLGLEHESLAMTGDAIVCDQGRAADWREQHSSYLQS